MAKDVQQVNVSKGFWRRNDGGLVFSLNDNSNTKLGINQSANSGYANFELMVNGTPGTRRLNLDNIVGNAGFAISRSWQTYSSRRWKNTIAPITGALKLVGSLIPATWIWNADRGGNRDFGFIAEDLAQVLPEAVAWGDDGSAEGVDATRIIPYLTAAIQEQQAQIEELKAAVAALQESMKAPGNAV